MFKLTANQALGMALLARANSTQEEIEEKIESLIKKEADKGQTTADYIPSYRDQLLQDRPNIFKESLKKLGYSVSFRRDDNPREGNNEIILMRISWNKQ